MTKEKLQARKQQVVRDAIYDAAIGLFKVKGFDETTVDEIAQVAGISRRSFFHYYASKDDLLAQNTVSSGDALVEAVIASAPNLAPFEVLRETVMAGIKYTAEQPELREMIGISSGSIAARKAQASRFVEIEDRVSEAYAQHLKNPSKFGVEPRLLAHLTMSIMKVAITAWFTGEHQDLSTSAEHVIANLSRLTSNGVSSLESAQEVMKDKKLLRQSSPLKGRSKTVKKTRG